MSNGSGDYVIAFSTHPQVRRDRTASKPVAQLGLMPAALSPLFNAVVEATEEAIYNALFMATTVEGRGRALRPLPVEQTLRILRSYELLDVDKRLPPLVD